MEEKVRKRETWSGRTAFIMAAIGSAVGLGNLWRFPYIAYKNGGGAFLIPYFIALITTGIPLMILEFGVGFLKQGSAPEAFKKIKDKYEWIGWWGVLVGSVICIYYMVVMAWCLNYLWYSFDLRWKNYKFEKKLITNPIDYKILIDNGFIKEIKDDKNSLYWIKSDLSEDQISKQIIDLKIENSENIKSIWKESQKSPADFFKFKMLNRAKMAVNSSSVLNNIKFNFSFSTLGQNLKDDILKIKTDNSDIINIFQSEKNNIIEKSIQFNIEDTVFNDEVVGTIDSIKYITGDNKKDITGININLKLLPEVKQRLVNSKLLKPLNQVNVMVWKIVFGLAICWIIVYLIIYKGVQRVGAIVKWTVPLPIVLLLVLLIRGLTLDGALEGIRFYLTPDFSVLKNPKVWLAAYSQIFFSLSIGFGILIAYASYMKKDPNAEIASSAYITSFANCATSYFAGFTVFSIIGALSFINKSPVAETMGSGPGLTFVVFPTALSKMPLAPLFAVLFFITLLSLGIDSAFSLVEAFIAAIDDKLKGKFNRKKLTFVVCLTGFLLGLIFSSRAGLYWLDIVDNWMNNYGLAFVGLAECIVVGYLINTSRFRNSLNKMSSLKIDKWWEICIKYITPAILIYSIGDSILSEIKTPYEGYPGWAINSGGWTISVGVVLIGLFLMETYHKWLYKIKMLICIFIVALIVTGKTAFAMFIFGTVFLFGGLIKYLLQILHRSQKNIFLSIKNPKSDQSVFERFIAMFGVEPAIFLSFVIFALSSYVVQKYIPLPAVIISKNISISIAVLFILIWIVCNSLIYKNIPESKKNLGQTGIHKYIRFPNYTVTLVCGAIVLLAVQPNMWMLIGIIFTFLSTQFMVEYEEHALKDIFGQKYLDYCKTAGKYLPKLKLFQ